MIGGTKKDGKETLFPLFLYYSMEKTALKV